MILPRSNPGIDGKLIGNDPIMAPSGDGGTSVPVASVPSEAVPISSLTSAPAAATSMN